jgi:hypothetical protein
VTGAAICQYTERLVVEFLQRQQFDWIADPQIHKGFEKPIPGELEGGVSIAQQVTPMIQVICAQAEARAPHFTGNWDVQMDVIVMNSTKDASDATHQQRTDQVFSLFHDEALLWSLLPINPNFWFARLIVGPETNRIEGLSFASTGQFTLLSCCAQAMIDPNLLP